MLTTEEHTKLLRSFEVDHLLTLMAVEAKRCHDGTFAILAFNSGFKVAFGTPHMHPGFRVCGDDQVAAMEHFPTVKEALIAALIAGKTFQDYARGDVFDPDKLRLPDAMVHPNYRR